MQQLKPEKPNAPLARGAGKEAENESWKLESIACPASPQALPWQPLKLVDDFVHQPWHASSSIILNGQWRVAFDQLQWVLQRWSGDRWRDRSFCVTRAALLRCIHEHCGVADISEVLKLPEWHPDRNVATAAEDQTLAEPPTDLVPALLPGLKTA